MKKSLILFLVSILVFPALGQDKVGILTTNPLGTLDIHRGTANEGTLVARGTNYPSHFNIGTLENTIIRGGKNGSHVFLNDLAGLGNVAIGTFSNPLQKLHVVGSTYITDNLGLGIATPLQKLHVVGNSYITGKLGLGVASPNGTLQFANTLINRKIVLLENANDDHQFYGFGINANTLRYQVGSTANSHAFFAGTTSGTSAELMRIKGDGSVAIGTTSPDNSALLQLNSTTRGILIPRMTTQQRNVIVSPEPGLMILNLDDQCIDIFDGTNWIKNCGLKNTGIDTLPPGWTTIANFSGTPREGAIAFSIGTKGYMGTGFDGSFKNDFWEYNPATNIWTQKANASPTIRSEAVGISIDCPAGECGYIGTGQNEFGFLNDWWEYFPAENLWLPKSPFPGAPRSEAVGFPHAGFGYVGTGKNNADLFSDIWSYDAFDETWSSIQDFPYDTYGAVGFSGDGYAAIGTGWKQGNPNYTTSAFYYYDLSEGWLPLPDIDGGDRHSAVAFVSNEEAYVGLGKSDDNILKNDIWKWNSGSWIWIQQPVFPGTARANAVAFSINEKAYIGTGNDGGYKQDFRVYDLYPQGYAYSTPALPQPLYSMTDGLWVKELNTVYPSNPTASMIGIGLSDAVNQLDINTGPARTGYHITDRPLYVTGSLSSPLNAIEFRHSNGTQGIGFSDNTIYATGSDANQNLGLAARGGSGFMYFQTEGGWTTIYPWGIVGIGAGAHSQVLNVGGNTFITDNVGIGASSPLQKLHVAGNVYVTNYVGIGLNTPNAPLQFPFGSQNRKIVLHEHANNNHQFFGFGIGGGELRYQVNSPADHVFYKGISSTQSVELMRIKDNLNLSIAGLIETEAFVAATLQNNFTNYGGEYATAAYYKDKMGVVRLRGLVNNNGNPNFLSIFTLPTGYRPSTSGTLAFMVGNNNAMGQVNILSDGTVQVYAASAGWISLDQIEFKAD